MKSRPNCSFFSFFFSRLPCRLVVWMPGNVGESAYPKTNVKLMGRRGKVGRRELWHYVRANDPAHGDSSVFCYPLCKWRFFFPPGADSLSAQSTWKSRLNLKMKCAVLLFIYENEKSARLLVDKMFRVRRVKSAKSFTEAVISGMFYFYFFYLLLPPDSLATIFPSNVLGPLKRKIKEIYHSVIYFDVCEYKLASTSFCLPVFPRNWKNTNFLIAYGFKRNKHNPELTYRCWLTVTSPRFRHSTLHLASTVSDVYAHLFLSIITSIVVITVFVALWKQQPAIRPCGLTPNAFMNQRQETS